MNKHILIAALLAGVAVTGCKKDNAPADHTDVSEAHGERQEDAGGLSITHHGASTEIFVEFQPLVQGQPTAFAAHMTHLGGEKSGADAAVSQGTLTVILSGGDKPEERVAANISNAPGIFRPILTAKGAGARRLTFQLAAPGLNAIHEVGEVLVYPDARTAQAATPKEAPHGGGAIAFSKEAQWKVEFAIRPVGVRRIRESIAVTGTLKPPTSSEAQISAPANGILRAGPFGFPQVGMSVKPGQVLGYLVTQLGGETDVSTLQLAVDRANIAVHQAREQLTRLEELYAAEAVPEKRVREARSALDLAAAEQRSAKQRFSSYNGGSGGIALKAPIAGSVVATSASPGGAVQAGQLLVHIADLKRLWLEARIPEADIGRVQSPAGAFFEIAGKGPITLEVGGNAKLVTFGGMVDAASRTVPAILEFENPDRLLRAGMQVRASLYTGRDSNAPAVPSEAVVDDNGQTVVYVQLEGEIFERRLVQLGAREANWVAVRSGVVPGERVVTRGAYQIMLAATAPAAIGHGHAH